MTDEALFRDVTSVDEEVARRDWGLGAMGIGEEDDGDRVGVRKLDEGQEGVGRGGEEGALVPGV